MDELDKKLEPFPLYETLLTLICVYVNLHVEFCSTFHTGICSCRVCTAWLISTYSASVLSGANLLISFYIHM